MIESNAIRQARWARLIADVSVVLLVAGWWYVARGLPAFVVPGPVEVARELARFASEWPLFEHLATSFVRVTLSAIVAVGLALALALATRRSPVGNEILQRRVLLFFNSFPAIGWAILGVIWFQVSSFTVVFIQIVIILPFCLNNAIEGLRQIDPELEELGRSLTVNRWRRFTRLTLPLMAPFLVAGLRISYGICWKIALVAELFGAERGLGYLLLQAQSSANAALVIACCILIVIVFTATDRFVLRPLEARFSRNQTQARG